ncbi:MAG: Lrp/AsnC family transcriptional regulator [Brachybacterium tyrofermentans]|uniref:Lrp/AsnC family transcriptional regulator n=2 Tax=Brachybacterium tyrofermentans TaxID=47848 RepID=UPI003F8E19DE
MSIDDVDRAILENLREDGRLSNVALADRVHLTPGPCLRRVQRLEADGVILGYAAQVSPEALGRAFEVILDVDLTAYDRGTVEHFETTVAAFDEVIELNRLFGSPDYFVRVAVSDLEAYEHFLTEQIITIPGVSKISSRFTMKVLKSQRPSRSTAASTAASGSVASRSMASSASSGPPSARR